MKQKWENFKEYFSNLSKKMSNSDHSIVFIPLIISFVMILVTAILTISVSIALQAHTANNEVDSATLEMSTEAENTAAIAKSTPTVAETVPETTENEEVSEEEEVEEEYTIIGNYSDFSLAYIEDTSELLCVRDGKPIGRKVAVKPAELIAFLNYIVTEDNRLGYIFENSLIYPIFVKDFDGGISFYLYPIETFEKEPVTVYDGFIGYSVDQLNRYSIYDGKVYYLKDTENNLFTSDSIGSKNIPLASEFISLTIAELAPYGLTDFKIYDCSGYITVKSTFNDHLDLYGLLPSDDLTVKSMIENGLFAEYISEDGTSYEFSNMPSAKEAMEHIKNFINDEGEKQ